VPRERLARSGIGLFLAVPDSGDDSLDEVCGSGEDFGGGFFDVGAVGGVFEVGEVDSYVVEGAADGGHGELGADGEVGEEVGVDEVGDAVDELDHGDAGGGHGLGDADAGEECSVEAGCALVRNPRDLLNAFSYQPPYYNFNDEAINYFDLGPQNTRGFRALKVWLALRQAGRAGYQRMIGDDMRLARHLYKILGEHAEFEVFTQNLSITTFRYVPESLRSGIGTEAVEATLNRINQELLKKIDESGQLFLSNAIIDGKYALRACIVNFQTALEDIEAIPEIVSRLGRAD